MSNFLITGGAGFIGSNITHRLLEEGYTVKIIDNFATGKKENIEDIKNKMGSDPVIMDVRGCLI